jgi:hypothetical protein
MLQLAGDCIARHVDCRRCHNPTPDPTPTATADPPPQPPIWATTHIPTLVRVHAPDHIIAQLGGIFQACTTTYALPPANRLAPHNTSYEGGELYLWWTPTWWTPTWPNDRQPSPGRRAVVRTLLTLAVRMRAEGRANAAASDEPLIPFMPSDMWLMVLGFIVHDRYNALKS